MERRPIQRLRRRGRQAARQKQVGKANMQTEVLAEAIECLEKGKELIRFRVLKKLDRTDEVYHNAVMAIGHHISLLKNELHYAEKEKLANWRKAFQQSLQRTVPKQAQFARYRVRKNKKALLAVRR